MQDDERPTTKATSHAHALDAAAAAFRSLCTIKYRIGTKTDERYSVTTELAVWRRGR